MKKVVVERKRARARTREVIEERRPHAHVDEWLMAGTRREEAGSW